MSLKCDTPVERLDLSVRAYVCLKRAEVDTVADLLAMEAREIALVFRGRKESLDELRRELAMHARRSLLNRDDPLGLAAMPVSTLDLQSAAQDKLISSGIDRVAGLIDAPRARLHRLLGRTRANALLVKVWAYCVVAGADIDGAPAPPWVAECAVADGSGPSEPQDDSLLGLFQTDVARLPPLNRADEVLLGGKIQRARACGGKAPGPDAGDGPHEPSERLRQQARQARTQIVEGTVAWAIQWAQDYGERGLELMDVIQEGCMGLLSAADRFDHRARGRFQVYAWWWASQAITRAIGEQGGVVRLPAHVYERVMQLEGALDQLYDTLPREPSAKEVSLALGLLSPEDSLAIEQALITGTTVPMLVRRRLDRAALKVRRLAALAAQPVFLDATIDEDSVGADADLRQLLDEAGLSPREWTGHCVGELLLREPAGDPLEGVAQEQLKAQIREALSSLADRERLVLELRYGLTDGEDRTLEEIGQVIGVTRERVRQIEARGLTRLRHPKRSRQLRDYSN